jgi:hypothetical protein
VPGEMSSLCLVEAFAPDPEQPKEGIFSFDQRLRIAGGRDRLPAGLAGGFAGAGGIVVAGEHMSATFSGDMKGGVESGRRAAAAVLARLG